MFESYVKAEDFERFKDRCPIEFLPDLEFESEQVESRIAERTQSARSKDRIPSEKIWMGVYFHEEMEQKFHPKVLIEWMGEEIGFGVVAKQRIPACSFVGEYTGIIQERRRKEIEGNDYCVRYPTWSWGMKSYVINAKEKGHFTRFINHSDRPNVGLQSIYWQGLPRMVLISLVDIEKGAQLTFDYGETFWKESKKKPIMIS